MQQNNKMTQPFPEILLLFYFKVEHAWACPIKPNKYYMIYLKLIWILRAKNEHYTSNNFSDIKRCNLICGQPFAL